MTMDVLTAVLAANLATALAALAILALRPLIRPRFGARAVYALWIAPPLAALAVLVPHRQAAATIPFVARATGVAARALPIHAAGGNLWAGVLIGAWAAGALVMAALLIRRQHAFLSSLGRLTPLSGDPWRVLAERAGGGPALVGALRPRIVTPPDFESRYDAQERDLILAHERTHLAAGDTLANALACAVQCLGWFNPLVHLGVRAMRIDQELACDAEVIGRYPQARRLYGELLLKTQLAAQTLPLGCHWPAGGEHPLKERIAMLKSPLPALAERRAGLAVAALLALGAVGGAWAASAQSPSVVTMPDWLIKPVPADLVAAYPADALKAHVEGMAVIGCGVAVDGKLTGCKVLKETPADAGFGTAALALSARFQMKPMSKDGHPVAGGVVRIPIRFMMPNAAPPAPSA